MKIYLRKSNLPFSPVSAISNKTGIVSGDNLAIWAQEEIGITRALAAISVSDSTTIWEKVSA